MGKSFPPLWREVARLQDHLIGRNIDVLAGVVYFIRRNKFSFATSVLTTPAGKRAIVKISKLVIPATPPLKGGESYLPIILIITAGNLLNYSTNDNIL